MHKVKECCEVIIQNIENSIRKQMVYKYLIDSGIENHVKSFRCNSKHGFILMEFYQHEKAIEYYYQANLEHRILIRPLNIYLNVELNDNEMKKYYFEGADEKNIRQFFNRVSRIAPCKFYISYQRNNRLRSNGLVSLMMNKHISNRDFKELVKELKKIGVQLSFYEQKRGFKTSIQFENIYEDDLNLNEKEIEKKTENIITAKLNAILDEQMMAKAVVHVMAKKRAVSVGDPELEQYGVQTTIKTSVEFPSSQLTMKCFEGIRLAFVKEPKMKATLRFQNIEDNKYIMLFTKNIKKPSSLKNLTEKQFEAKLVESFRKIDENVLQVLIFPVQYSKNYIAKIFLRDEISGKNFVVEYPEMREQIIDFFDDPNIVFDIFNDEKANKRLGQLQTNANLFKTRLDLEGEFIRRGIPLPNETKPISQEIQVDKKIMKGMPNIAPNLGNSHSSSGLIPNFGNSYLLAKKQPQQFSRGLNRQQQLMRFNYPNDYKIANKLEPQQQLMKPIKNPVFMENQPLKGVSLPFASTSQLGEINKLISQLVRHKDSLISQAQMNQKESRKVKKTLVEPIRYILQYKFDHRSVDCGILLNKILIKHTVPQVLDFLQNPKERYSSIMKKIG